MTDMYELLCALTAAEGVTGNETGAGRVVSDCFRKYTQDVWRDKLGNVYAKVGTGSPVVLIAAHMDEIGLMVTAVEENGMLRLRAVGGVDPRILPGSEAVVYGKNGPVKGVIGAVPPHIQTGEEGAYKLEELVLDIGYEKEQAEQLVRVGDFVTFQNRPPMKLKNNFVTSKTLDDRALVAAMVECLDLLKNYRLGCTVIFCASVQEEIGGVGSMVASYSVEPDIALAIDVTHGVTPGAPQFKAIEMDKVAITRGGNIHEKVFAMLQASAEEQNIGYETEVMMGMSGTDAWEMQVSRGGVATGILSPPLRYMHTSVETLSLDTLKNCAKVLAGMIKNIGPDWEEQLCLDD